MSFIGNLFKFEKFKFGRDLMELKSHPQRLLFGPMMDPLSTKIENTVTGSHFKPRSDQMGGAYGGRTISAFGGGQEGGVYKEAADHGIDTSAGKTFENAAHIGVGVAGAIAGGAALAGAGAGAGGAGSTAALTEFTPAEISAMGGGIASPTVGAGATAGAGSSAAPAASGSHTSSFIRTALNLAQQGGGQKQPQLAPQTLAPPESTALPPPRQNPNNLLKLTALQNAQPQNVGGAD